MRLLVNFCFKVFLRDSCSKITIIGKFKVYVFAEASNFKARKVGKLVFAASLFAVPPMVSRKVLYFWDVCVGFRS